MSTRIFVVEDHASMREALVGFVSTIPGLESCGTAESGEEALARLGDAAADVVLIDISLPGMNGLELLEQVRAKWPELRCVMLSAHAMAAYQARAISSGAHGYVPKGNATRLRDAISAVREGRTYFAP